MSTKRSLILLFSFLVTGHAFAIDPFYEGPNGIREQVFAPHCLACHSSGLTGPNRNGAPPDVNFDTYEATLPNAERAMVRAVGEMSMPPAGSNVPPLNDEQKAAMSAWQSRDFPRTAVSSFDGTMLMLPVLNVDSQQVSATLIGTPLENSPTGYGFILDEVIQSTAFSEHPATFDPETGQMLLPSVEVIERGVSQGSGDAQLRWVAGTGPMVFALENPGAPAMSPPAIFDGLHLILPVVNVGNQKYHAILKSLPLLTSPSGVGFVLESAKLTSASTDEPAVYDPATGQLDLPSIRTIQAGVRQGLILFDMVLIPGSDPLLFSLNAFTVNPGAPWYPSNP